jgi:uncharacterized membrane-anchored protein
MKRVRLVWIIALQIVLLLSIVGKYHYIAASGQTITLKTAPVDPRDLFQGDYVRLHYEISEIDTRSVRNDLRENESDLDVYVLLERKANPWHEAVGVFRERPLPRENQAVLRGRLLYVDEKSRMVSIDYGLGRYYVPENTGREWEQKTDLLVDLKVTDSGEAIIERLR